MDQPGLETHCHFENSLCRLIKTIGYFVVDSENVNENIKNLMLHMCQYKLNDVLDTHKQ